MKKKRIKMSDGEMRVISIDRDAVFEWLCESMIEHGKDFFFIEDISSVTFHCTFERDTGEFLCAILEDPEDVERLRDIEVNWDAVRAQTGTTTPSLFFGPDNKKLYKSLNWKKTPGLWEINPDR